MSEFALIAIRFIEFDSEQIRQHGKLKEQGLELNLISLKYFKTLKAILNVENVPPLFDNLFAWYNCPVLEIPNAILARVTTSKGSSGLLPNIANFWDQLLANASDQPGLTEISRLPQELYNVVLGLVKTAYRHGPTLSDVLVNVIMHLRAVCMRIDHRYLLMVEKQAPSLSIDLSRRLLDGVADAYADLVLLDRDAAWPVLRVAVGEVPDAELDQLPGLVAYAYRFRMCLKCAKEGRMELRVQGVETIANNLLAAYKKFIEPNVAALAFELPIVRYLISFIRTSKIVDYVLGVDSHPQLISRLGHIIGFLAVTKSYEPEDVDKLWQSMTSSHDMRTVEAIVWMLQPIYGLMEERCLIRFCEKFSEVPLADFDEKMINFCRQVLSAAANKHAQRYTDEPLDTAPYQVILRLIRHGSASDEIPGQRKMLMRNFGYEQMGILLKMGPSTNDKQLMYAECMQDIAEKQPNALGSIYAIDAMLGQPPIRPEQLEYLVENFDFTNVIIAELAHTVSREMTSATLEPEFIARLRLVEGIIQHLPETLTIELSESLWHTLLLAPNLTLVCRNYSWATLSKIVSEARAKNSYLDRCLSDYLSQLPVESYTEEFLKFLEKSVNYECRIDPPPPAAKDGVVVIPGVDRIWHVMLTAPSHTIEMGAIALIIKLFLDFSIMLRAAEPAIVATHIWLVNRCISGLSNAASQLKSYSDGTMSGEDEPMVIVASDTEIQTQELRFSRSLLLLKDFVQAVRSRPRYRNIKPISSGPNGQGGATNGDLICLSFQTFEDGKRGEVRKLQIGELETASNLAERLVGLTGWSKFDTVVGGGRLKLLEEGSKTLQDLRVGKTGMLLVRKAVDAVDVQNIAVNREPQEASAIDQAILQHFQAFYEYLGFEERLSRDVSNCLFHNNLVDANSGRYSIS